jgi:hypothetical protein
MLRLAGVLAALALLLVGCGGSTETVAGGADIVPADVPAFVSFNTDLDSDQWQMVTDLADRFPDKEEAIKFIQKSLREEDLDWDRDVKPALGPELDLVWLDFGNDGENLVGLMQPDDEDAFRRLAKKDPDDEIVYEEFRGWYVLAENRANIERFKRESEAGGSLDDSEVFNDAMESYPEDSLFRGYVNGAAVMEIARREADPDFRKFINELGSLDWFAAGLRAAEEGIRFDATAHGTAGRGLKGLMMAKPFRSALQDEIPSDALLYWTFHGAKGMFTGLEENPLFTDVPELKQYSGLLRRLESLLQGENAIYVRPGAGKIPEVTIVTEPAAGTNGMATLDRILERYRSQLELPSRPQSSRVAGVPVRVLDFLFFKVYYGNVGKRLVVTDLPAGIKALKGDPKPIAESDEYEGALGSSEMPSKTQGFLYVNIRGGIRYAERLAGTPLPGDVRRNLGPLRSAVEYAVTRPSEVQVTFFLRIK